MTYTVKAIEEDMAYGCEEHDEDLPVLAVVTLEDENGVRTVLRTPDDRLREAGVTEGCRVTAVPCPGLPGLLTLIPAEG